MVGRCQRRRKIKSGKLFPPGSNAKALTQRSQRRQSRECAGIYPHRFIRIEKIALTPQKERDFSRNIGAKNKGISLIFASRYAALVAVCVAAGSSHRTDTSFETPGSCIVTP